MSSSDWGAWGEQRSDPGLWGCAGWVTSPVQGEGLVGLTPLSPQDYISLFPLDDTQPSKLMRLLSSNEEDSNILSSPSKCRRGGRTAPLPCCPFWV